MCILRLVPTNDGDQLRILLKRRAIALGVLLQLLYGCGGGSDSPANPVPSPVPPPAVPPPPVGGTIPGPRPTPGPRPYVLFESGPVRPVALSADATRLYVTNIPDAKLEIFDVSDQGLTPLYSVPVGLEPVAVAEAGDGTVWVVNHLSDNVSVVDTNRDPPRVVRTLWVGDEPRDIVFAGVNRSRAFITTAHRGQRSPVDPQLTFPGIGRADVWVFDNNNLGSEPGGSPLAVQTLFGDRPRPLAATADGSRVYAGIFLSGNRTTVLAPSSLAKAPPSTSADGVVQPNSGLIIRFNGANWVDERGVTFNSSVPFTLPDLDVFEIDALADPPVILREFSGVGTTLFNIAVNPVNDALYVTNLNARNHVRFAGEATRASTTVRGHLTDNRITVIRDGVVTRRLLNKHLDFSRRIGTADERDRSLSTPLDVAVSADGKRLFVAAFGSQKVAIFDTAALEDDSFIPDTANHIEVSGGGPAGIALDDVRGRAYVYTRFDNGVSILDIANKTEIAHLLMFNPEPASVTAGRPFHYDARLTSSRGNDSCASCHLFGSTDGLAWDLGDPDGVVKAIPNTFIPISPAATPFNFHPMKGPMTTQSMRGLTGHGPMHWRGDRTGAARADDETLEEAAFKEFNEAFEGLMAREQPLTDAEMQAFTDFAMQLTYPPNPIRNLDNSLTPNQENGLAIYNRGVVRVQTGALEVCARCHRLDPAAGLFGTRGLMADNSQPGERNFKIPHFRDQYQKVGMFGFGFQSPPARGPQIRGFGYNHNGATTSNFIIADLGMPSFELFQLRSFLFAFPTESAPIVGQQVTRSASNAAEAASEIDLLIERALVDTPIPECDLIVKGVIAGAQRGWLMDDQQMFMPDRSSESPVSRTDLEALADVGGDALTFTCTPWGSGPRMGIDRDEDGVLDGDE